MKASIGIRLDEKIIKKLEDVGEEENLDRSTMIRKFLEKGYKDYLKEKAADKYKKGKLTISGAAELADLTIWEMEKYLVDEGYVSDYSMKDMVEELKLLDVIYLLIRQRFFPFSTISVRLSFIHSTLYFVFPFFYAGFFRIDWNLYISQNL